MRRIRVRHRWQVIAVAFQGIVTVALLLRPGRGFRARPTRRTSGAERMTVAPL